jgi:hypothetical protein
MELILTEYVPYIREHKQPSLATIDNYTRALVAIDMNTVDTDKIPDVYKRLLELLPTKGYGRVEQYVAVLRAWMRKNGHELPTELNYHKLMDTIAKMKGHREAYSDDQMKDLFASTRKNVELQKLLILMTYSGLRIGACYPIHYDDLLEVPEHPEVMTYQVTSKGTTYHAIISKKAFGALNRFKQPGQTLVVQHDNDYSAPFANRYRDMFTTALRRDGLYDLRKDTSIFHSVRKYYSNKLLASELNPTDYDYKILMGHIPKNTMATKYYITASGKKVPLDLIKRISTSYEKTDLVKMELGLY